MNLLSRIKNYFSEEVKETNLDWKEVALDLNQSLIETQEKLQEANQEIADLKKIVAIYKEKEKEKTMEYIYLVTIVGIGLWSLVNKLDDHAEMKQKERQLMANNVARMNLRNSDKQFTYDVEPPEGLK
ncbi:hypothetical protein RK090_04475 [Streptococcus pneumoniae]|nr:hypothetical protein [Streptococcus pneumoniae]